MEWIAEILFVLQGGVPIADTFWIFAWILFWCSLSSISGPYYLVKKKLYGLLLFIFLFFPGLFISIGPPLVQAQMLTECREQKVDISTENIAETSVKFIECRNKDNYYGEFGDWYIQGISQKGN